MRARYISAIFICLAASGIHAQTWEPVTGAENLAALFIDTVQTAELGGGHIATANYNADGTGELKAWGDTFAREWRVEGDDQICIRIDDHFQCWRIERNTEKQNEYRGTKFETGETVIFMVTEQDFGLQDRRRRFGTAIRRRDGTETC